MIPSRTLTRGLQRLAVYEWGTPGQGPTVLLVHGYPDCAGVWTPIAEALAADHHVVAYDVRGSGQSSCPPRVEDFELDELVRDMNVVIDAVSPDRPVHLVGHDWGSIQSWEAITTVPVSARVASFTSLSGPSLDHVGKLLQKRLASADANDLKKTVRQVGASWYMWFFQTPGVPPALWRIGFDKLFPRLIAAREDTQITPAASLKRDGINGINLYRANILQRLRAPRERYTEVPVQVVVAQRDPFVGDDLLEDLHLRVPRLWRRDINTGHWGIASHPGVIAGHLREFIRCIDSGLESKALEYARHNARREREFSGKVVVITGAGSGIGRETALLFGRLGATVVVADLSLAAATATCQTIQEKGGQAIAREVDVSDEARMQALAEWVGNEFGAADIVVNNAGIGVAGAFLDTTVDDWERVLRVNLWGVIHGSRLFGRQMVEQARAGHIINVASAAAYSPVKIMSAYATSKAAVLMLSDCLRADFSQYHVRVSSICPGIVDTGITLATRFVGVDDHEQQRRRTKAKSIYQKRNLKPTAVADAILSAVRNNRPEVPVGPEAWGMKWLGRISPALNRRLSALLPEV